MLHSLRGAWEVLGGADRVPRSPNGPGMGALRTSRGTWRGADRAVCAGATHGDEGDGDETGLRIRAVAAAGSVPVFAALKATDSWWSSGFLRLGMADVTGAERVRRGNHEHARRSDGIRARECALAVIPWSAPTALTSHHHHWSAPTRRSHRAAAPWPEVTAGTCTVSSGLSHSGRATEAAAPAPGLAGFRRCRRRCRGCSSSA